MECLLPAGTRSDDFSSTRDRLYGKKKTIDLSFNHNTLITIMQQGNHLAPLVSIALATYNGERYLAQQLNSLVNQTYPNIEIVVSDDGSTDQTHNILSVFTSKYPHITVHNNTGDKGVNNNFAHVLKQCQGEFIALCDQDDLWLPAKIEKLVNGIGDASLIYHDSLLVNEEGQSLEDTAVPNGYTGNDPMVFLLKNIVSGHACLFRRALLNDALPIPAAISHDWWLAAVAADNKGVRFLPEVLVHYRQHTFNASDFMNKKALNSGRTARELYLRDITRFACFLRMSANRSFFHEWFALHISRPGKWLCFRLFVLSFQKRRSLFLLHNKSIVSIFFRCLGLLWGFKLKGLFNRKYRFEPVSAVSITGEIPAVHPGEQKESSRVGV